MLVSRSGAEPRIDPEARIAPGATVVGDVTVGPGCYLDYGVVVASSGPPIRIEEGAIVFAGAVLRSTGGHGRPEHPLTVGASTIVGPQCSLAGCAIEEDCYVATAVIVLQGARVGHGSRLGAGSIVHAGTELPELSRVGMRCIAAPAEHGPLITANVEEARGAIARADFFARAFDLDAPDQRDLHREAAARLRAEVAAWRDDPMAAGPWR